jgi:mannose-6-phosphate isomerase
MNNIIRLQNNNVTRNVWGGRWLSEVKGLALGEAPVGESWEFSTHERQPSRVAATGASLLELFPSIGPATAGQGAPFLIKLIDARQALSLQVHPGDAYSRRVEHAAGKAESWVVLETGAGPGDGFLYLGFDPDERARFSDDAAFARAFRTALDAANARGAVSSEDERRVIAEPVLRFVNRVRVRPGDVFHLPPGTVHAIGAGVRLYEIQQSSDVTYRVWDWNRPSDASGGAALRPLHLDKAFDVLDFTARPADHFRPVPDAGLGGLEARETFLVACREGEYRASLLQLHTPSAVIDVETRNRFQVFTVISGAVAAETDGGAAETFNAFSTGVVPATLSRYRLRGVGSEARVIRAEHWTGDRST